MALLLWLALAGAPLAPVPLQAGKDKKAGHPGVDQKKVDAAIEKGIQWLVKQTYEGKSIIEPALELFIYDEFVLLTLVHAGVSPRHPVAQELLTAMLKSELKKTYHVAVQAMILSQLDPTQYQGRIAQCAQFLADNQTESGGWSYGQPTVQPSAFPSSAAKDVGSEDARVVGEKRPPRPKRIIQIRPQRTGSGRPDTSNSQYAALGLRACMEAHVFPPRETLERAKKYWETQQYEDGSWHYFDAKHPGHGGFVAGGLGSLIIYKHYLKESWAADPHVTRALRWMDENFTVEANPKQQPDKMDWYPYYMYAVERAGVFSGRPHFGQQDWYRLGVAKILAFQKPDGSFDDRNDTHGSCAIGDTCFAILFLKRGTPALAPVASVDRFVRDK